MASIALLDGKLLARGWESGNCLSTSWADGLECGTCMFGVYRRLLTMWPGVKGKEDSKGPNRKYNQNQ